MGWPRLRRFGVSPLGLFVPADLNPSGKGPAWVPKSIAVTLALALTAPLGLLSPLPTRAQAIGNFGGFLELSSALFGEGGRTFYTDEVITVSGAIPFVPFCPGMLAANPGSVTGRGEGRFDFFPVADLYVISHSDQPLAPFATLNDVSGGVNRVTGTGTGGAFVDEVIAITRPAGNLDTGRYDVVMDQCLDGVYDPGIDIVLGGGPNVGFEVQLPGPLAAINYSPIKQSARAYADALDGKTFSDPLGNPIEVPGFCKLFSKMVDKGNLDNASALYSWADIAKLRCGDLIKHFSGIANDPPDPNFTQFAELGPLNYIFSAANSPIERIMRDLSHTLAEQAAESQALLTSIERFQGAQVAGNDEYMILQLEEANKFINLLVTNGGSLLRLYAILETLERELPSSQFASLQETSDFLAFFPEMRRAIAGLFVPLGPQFKRLPANQMPDLVPLGFQSWIITYLGRNPFLFVLPGLSGIPQDREARGLPPINFVHPDAAALGPWATPPGRAFVFDGSKSSDPNGDTLTYAWDFDGDGQFNDASGPSPSFTFPEPGARLIGLKVTDPAGNTDVSYGQLNVGDVNVQDVIVLSNRQQMYRVSPSGSVTTLRPALPAIASPASLHVDVNGDIWVLQPSRGLPFPGVLERYNSTGSLVSSITSQQMESLLGFKILNVIDFVLDGRGDIIMSVLEDLGPGFIEYLDWPIFNQVASNLPGRIKVVRLAKDGSRASLIADVDQNYYQLVNVNGQLVRRDFFARSVGSHSAALAIDPNGKIVVAHVNNLIWPNFGTGIFTLDPDTGEMTEVIPDARHDDPLGTFGSGKYIFAGLGGIAMPPWGGVSGATRPGDPGIEVDAQGNYFVGKGSSAGEQLRLARIPIPPRITPDTTSGLHNSWVVEVFPLSLVNPGTPFLLAMDIALDSGGDVIVAGSDFAGLFPPGVFRVTQLGQFSQVAAIPTPPDGFGGVILLDVVPGYRKVTEKDLPPLPQFRLENLRVDLQACPRGADLRVDVRNSGSVNINDPVRVFFYDGDPQAGGVAIGSAATPGGIAAGSTIQLTARWTNPGAGIHQVFATAVGFGSTPSRSFMVCVPTPSSGQDAIQLSPLNATTNIGANHTVTASVKDIYGNPVAGVPITFNVSGANTTTGSATTDNLGLAVFTYAGSNAGQDTIEASFPNGGTSNAVVNDWLGAAADSTPPVLALPGNITQEATGPAGATVNFIATASDAVDGSVPVTCVPASGSTFALGTTAVNCSATDAARNTSAGSFNVTVQDTTAPKVTPPAAITVAATEAGGARGSAVSALAAFLAGGSAADIVDAFPLRLAPQVGGADADNNTLFPIGMTPVLFRWRDASGNFGSTASTVTVKLGTPRIAGTLLRKGRDSSGAYFVDVALKNTGDGNARNVGVTQVALRTLSGSGTVGYDSSLSPALPIAIGSLDVGASTVVRFYLNLPPTVTRFSITESGTAQNVAGTNFSFSTAQSVIP